VEQASACEGYSCKAEPPQAEACSTKPLKSFTVRTATYDDPLAIAIFARDYLGLGRLADNTQISATTDSAAAV